MRVRVRARKEQSPRRERQVIVGLDGAGNFSFQTNKRILIHQNSKKIILLSAAVSIFFIQGVQLEELTIILETYTRGTPAFKICNENYFHYRHFSIWRPIEKFILDDPTVSIYELFQTFLN